MSSDLRCETWQAKLSERIDKGHHATDPQLEDHLSGCSDCRSFEASLHELRRSIRLMPLEPTPDVAPRVMEELATGRPDTRRFRIKLATVGAAAAALLVLATALPVLDTAPDVARGAEITERAFAAGRELTSYHATFAITERGWHPQIRTRRFDAEIWFRAPETFRLRLRDRTSYPSSAWPDNDFDVVSTPSRWSIRESFSCPPAALPGCATEAGGEARSIFNRQPFDGASDAPRDLMVPLESLAASDAFSVLGSTTVGGRDAYHLSLPYRHAFPLAQALQIGGSWTTLSPEDDVELWVDRDTGFPLRFEVTGQGGVRLEVNMTSLEEPERFGRTTFDAPLAGTASDGGFAPGRGPSRRSLPTYVSGLSPYRSGRNAQGQRLATYADGLSYLKVIADDRIRPLPALVASAEIVRLRDDSQAFYRPAEPGAPRRLDIYGADGHVQIASNLRRGEILRVGESIPLQGRAEARIRDGKTTVERLTLAQAGNLPFAKVPRDIPDGYRLAASVRVTHPQGDQLILRYAPAQSGAEGTDIRIVQSADARGLPPTSEDLDAVELGDTLARWSEIRGELEWVDADGVYRAIGAPAFGRAFVVEMAEQLR